MYGGSFQATFKILTRGRSTGTPGPMVYIILPAPEIIEKLVGVSPLVQSFLSWGPFFLYVEERTHFAEMVAYHPIARRQLKWRLQPHFSGMPYYVQVRQSETIDEYVAVGTFLGYLFLRQMGFVAKRGHKPPKPPNVVYRSKFSKFSKYFVAIPGPEMSTDYWLGSSTLEELKSLCHWLLEVTRPIADLDQRLATIRRFIRGLQAGKISKNPGIRLFQEGPYVVDLELSGIKLKLVPTRKISFIQVSRLEVVDGGAEESEEAKEEEQQSEEAKEEWEEAEGSSDSPVD